jgi:hypothetical protein
MEAFQPKTYVFPHLGAEMSIDCKRKRHTVRKGICPAGGSRDKRKIQAQKDASIFIIKGESGC